MTPAAFLRGPLAAALLLGGGGAEVPDPALCRVDPRPPAFIEELLAGLAPHEHEDEPGAGALALPPGRRADGPTTRAVEATLRELLACVNGGDGPRAAALHTDGYFLRVGWESPRAREVYERALRTAPPLPAEGRLGLAGVREARVLDEGDVAALVAIVDPAVGGAALLRVVSVPVGERYLVEWVDGPVPAPPDAAAAGPG